MNGKTLILPNVCIRGDFVCVDFTKYFEKKKKIKNS